jgi:hypothetical protein
MACINSTPVSDAEQTSRSASERKINHCFY